MTAPDRRGQTYTSDTDLTTGTVPFPPAPGQPCLSCHDGTVHAPELSETERAAVDRFEAEPDGWAPQGPWSGDLELPIGLSTRRRTSPQVLHADVVFVGYSETGEDRRVTENLDEAQVVTSLIAGMTRRNGGWHRLIVDVDLPLAVVPSSTPGHGHLYVDAPMQWPVYVRLLEALRDAGVLEQGYVAASIERGHTAVRLPWVRKGANDLPTTWEQLQQPPASGDPWAGLLADGPGFDVHGFPLGTPAPDQVLPEATS